MRWIDRLRRRLHRAVHADCRARQAHLVTEVARARGQTAAVAQLRGVDLLDREIVTAAEAFVAAHDPSGTEPPPKALEIEWGMWRALADAVHRRRRLRRSA